MTATPMLVRSIETRVKPLRADGLYITKTFDGGRMMEDSVEMFSVFPSQGRVTVHPVEIEMHSPSRDLRESLPELLQGVVRFDLEANSSFEVVHPILLGPRTSLAGAELTLVRMKIRYLSELAEFHAIWNYWSDDEDNSPVSKGSSDFSLAASALSAASSISIAAGMHFIVEIGDGQEPFIIRLDSCLNQDIWNATVFWIGTRPQLASGVPLVRRLESHLSAKTNACEYFALIGEIY